MKASCKRASAGESPVCHLQFSVPNSYDTGSGGCCGGRVTRPCDRGDEGEARLLVQTLFLGGGRAAEVMRRVACGGLGLICHA